MKKILIGILILSTFIFGKTTKAEEGLWLPTLSAERVKQMRKMGMKLTADEIYSVNNACLSGAVVGLSNEGLPFQSFATGSIISDNGLVVTNYHPVMRYIEFYSNNDRDFLKYGYWATKTEEESVCHGLWIKQLVRIEDVTQRILEGTEGLSGNALQNKITENNKQIVGEATKGNYCEALISTFNAANQYIMSVYKVYKDVRLVAAPPMSIGKFGGLADNWQWPRYCGDFAFLRIYVNGNQNPAKYNKERNVPLKSTNFLNVSLKGVRENDFAMVIGYPGSTREYIPAHALQKKIYNENIAKLQIATKKINILQQAVEEDSILRHRYTTRIASTSNSYLRNKGEVAGATRFNIVEIKQQRDSAFQKWANQTEERRKIYGNVLNDLNNVYERLAEYNMASIFLNDACLGGAEIVPYIGKFEKLVSMYGRSKAPSAGVVKGEVRRLDGLTDMFFGNWSYETDRKLMREMLIWSWENTSPKFHPEILQQLVTDYNGDVEKMTTEIFANSVFTDSTKVKTLLNDIAENGVAKITEDKLYQLSISFFRTFVQKVNMQQKRLQDEMSPLYTLYMKGLAEMNGGFDKIYPDANRTLRIAYGKIAGVSPEQSVEYSYATTLKGMNERSLMNPGNDDYRMPLKLRKLIAQNDYGQYADRNGELPTCFLSDCHTSSGNSGSPVLNGKGEFIGINFDRMWQGVVSDYHYEPTICRNISVDARYIFFLIDKYSRSGYILDEIKFSR